MAWLVGLMPKLCSGARALSPLSLLVMADPLAKIFLADLTKTSHGRGTLYDPMSSPPIAGAFRRPSRLR